MPPEEVAAATMAAAASSLTDSKNTVESVHMHPAGEKPGDVVVKPKSEQTVIPKWGTSAGCPACKDLSREECQGPKATGDKIQCQSCMECRGSKMKEQGKDGQKTAAKPKPSTTKTARKKKDAKGNSKLTVGLSSHPGGTHGAIVVKVLLISSAVGAIMAAIGYAYHKTTTSERSSAPSYSRVPAQDNEADDEPWVEQHERAPASTTTIVFRDEDQ
jgi:hypothetical protein